MPKKILISKNNPEFFKLMSELVSGLRANDALKINSVKSQFAEANIHIGYNKELDKLEVLEEGCRPVVLDAKKFEVAPAQPQPVAKVEVK